MHKTHENNHNVLTNAVFPSHSLGNIYPGMNLSEGTLAPSTWQVGMRTWLLHDTQPDLMASSNGSILLKGNIYISLNVPRQPKDCLRYHNSLMHAILVSVRLWADSLNTKCCYCVFSRQGWYFRQRRVC